MIFYSEAFDEYQIRLDAENIKFRTQIGIDFRIAGEGSALIKSYLETRKIAQKTLYDALLNEKWNAVDMRPLPLFAGYSPPKWREDMLIKA